MDGTDAKTKKKYELVVKANRAAWKQELDATLVDDYSKLSDEGVKLSMDGLIALSNKSFLSTRVVKRSLTSHQSVAKGERLGNRKSMVEESLFELYSGRCLTVVRAIIN
jgi:hypothetical protein